MKRIEFKETEQSNLCIELKMSDDNLIIALAIKIESPKKDYLIINSLIEYHKQNSVEFLQKCLQGIEIGKKYDISYISQLKSYYIRIRNI